jgi:hypothetical protein
LPFVQLLLCSLQFADNASVPFGTIGFFEPTVSSCPSGWLAVEEANGRFLMPGLFALQFCFCALLFKLSFLSVCFSPGWAGKGVYSSDAKPLSSGQDITHSHLYSANVKTSDVSYAGVDGCCNNNPAANGVYQVAGNSSSSSSELPYLQLLTCMSQQPTFEAHFPSTTMLFNQVACPPGWNVSVLAAGRFLVSLPQNGEAGATYGGTCSVFSLVSVCRSVYLNLILAFRLI